MNLAIPLETVSSALKMYASRLKKLEIFTLEDLLYHIPSRYDDFSLVTNIASVQPGEIVTIQGEVLEMKNDVTKNFKRLQKAVIFDQTGSIEVIWFNQPFLTKYIHKNSKISLSGKVEFFNRAKALLSPSYEIVGEAGTTIHTGRIVPIYPETKGVSSKWLRRYIYNFLKSPIDDYLPEEMLAVYNLMPLPLALWTIHFPKSLDDVGRAKERLAFDELLALQLRAMKRRAEWETNTKGNALSVKEFEKDISIFWEKLPFSLTLAQRNAIRDIFADLEKDRPMNRLVQGDVGSGKTVVATTAMYLAHLNGYQSVIMAPTEILAEQHYKTVSSLLSPLGVKVDLVTGNTKKRIMKQESRIKGKKGNLHDSSFMIHDSNFDILIGTHAVLYDKAKFTNLGLVVIDEQQRFGVEQRSLIRQKGNNPHVLTMTATPIPRTVALTTYGDLDLSYLDEMPKGRKIIKTWLVPTEKREGAYNWIRKQIQETNSQVFIVCPFIEQSESMQTVKAATAEYDRLQKQIFPDLRVGLLHGKLKAKEKEEVLTQFRNKAFEILVATPVVEVGIDIPNATIIVIEASERFGLAQLHQLRGRVGRGEKQSFCLLFTEANSQQTIQKLKSLETTHVGAQLAELDLRLRGPGDLYGTLQSGIPNLKVASFSDVALVQKARRGAEALFPELEKYPLLQEKLSTSTESVVSPD